MISPNFTIEYQSELTTVATHLFSGTQILTDAPLDNHGKASSFSPTDLVATALVSCMLSVVAIHYKGIDSQLHPITAKAKKIMKSDPRRIGSIEVEFDLGTNFWNEDEKNRFLRLVKSCPVAKSLNPEIDVLISFTELSSRPE